MLNKLIDIVDNLMPLLEDRSIWDSLIIDRRKPHTYRIFTYLEDRTRVCLHRFMECNRDEAFSHPHPWAGAFMILDGAYRMEVGLSSDRTDNRPNHVASFLLEKGSSYEITNPLTWHSVIPITTTHTVMINSPAWDITYAHESVKTTNGKDLSKMSDIELDMALAIFRTFIRRRNDAVGNPKEHILGE